LGMRKEKLVVPLGIPIIQDENLVEKTILGPMKKHRKKRIQKKWIKRYGYDYRLDYKCFRYNHSTMGEVIIAHPVIALQLRETLLNRTSRTPFQCNSPYANIR
jgi:hypothetical protein